MSGLDPDDLVQEAYARIYQSILRGGGPTGSFRAYLFTSIRNTAAAWGRSGRETAVDDLDAVVDPATSEEATESALDRGLTHRAFRSLPSRWQEVLWYTEIEQMKPAEIAPLLGMKPTAVAQLAFRAREGLREAWIQAHLQSLADDSDCQWTVEHLGAHARANLSRRDQSKVDAHLRECTRCTTRRSRGQRGLEPPGARPASPHDRHHGLGCLSRDSSRRRHSGCSAGRGTGREPGVGRCSIRG